MTNQNVQQHPRARVANTSREHPFLRLCGTYRFDGKDEVSKFGEDAGIFLAQADAILTALVCGLEDENGDLFASPKTMAELVYCAQNQLRMVANIVAVMNDEIAIHEHSASHEAGAASDRAA